MTCSYCRKSGHRMSKCPVIMITELINIMNSGLSGAWLDLREHVEIDANANLPHDKNYEGFTTITCKIPEDTTQMGVFNVGQGRFCKDENGEYVLCNRRRDSNVYNRKMAQESRNLEQMFYLKQGILENTNGKSVQTLYVPYPKSKYEQYCKYDTKLFKIKYNDNCFTYSKKRLSEHDAYMIMKDQRASLKKIEGGMLFIKDMNQRKKIIKMRTSVTAHNDRARLLKFTSHVNSNIRKNWTK